MNNQNQNAQLISMLAALAQMPSEDIYKAARAKQSMLFEQREALNAKCSKDAFAYSKNKWGTDYFSSKTDRVYDELTQALSTLVPDTSDADGQLGRTFYISTDEAKGEFVSITVARTNGVSASQNAVLDSVKKAQQYQTLAKQEYEMAKLAQKSTRLSGLARELTAILNALGDVEI